MWGIGCILYELLHVSLESTDQAKKEEGKDEDKWRHILFKGKYCFPMSPNPNQEETVPFGEHD